MIGYSLGACKNNLFIPIKLTLTFSLLVCGVLKAREGMHLVRGRKSLASAIIASYQVHQGVVTIIDTVVAAVTGVTIWSQDHGGTVLPTCTDELVCIQYT